MDRLKLSQTMAGYEARLEQMVADIARQIARGAGKRVYRNLKTPKNRSPLAESIRIDEEPDGGLRVFTDESYGRFVEFGTINQPARPFLTPATEEVKVTFSRFLE